MPVWPASSDAWSKHPKKGMSRRPKAIYLHLEHDSSFPHASIVLLQYDEKFGSCRCEEYGLRLRSLPWMHINEALGTLLCHSAALLDTLCALDLGVEYEQGRLRVRHAFTKIQHNFPMLAIWSLIFEELYCAVLYSTGFEVCQCALVQPWHLHVTPIVATTSRL